MIEVLKPSLHFIHVKAFRTKIGAIKDACTNLHKHIHTNTYACMHTNKDMRASSPQHSIHDTRRCKCRTWRASRHKW